MSSPTTRPRTLATPGRQPRRFCLQLLLLLGLLALWFLPAITRVIADSPGAVKATRPNGETPSLARLGESLSMRAAGRPNPLVNLGDGREVLTAYAGPEDLQQALAQNQAQPLSLASADFDEDGVPDLVSGYAWQGHGIVSLLRGNVDAIYPNTPEAQQRKRARAFTDAPFLGPATLVSLDETPDFVGVGDFDADGHWDIVAATRGLARLSWLRGDGRGNFGAPTRIDLDGTVTGLITGEMNQADGLNDVVVTVMSDKGAQLLIFQNPAGAFRARPETISLPGATGPLVLGQLDNDSAMDLAVAAGNDLILVSGSYEHPARRDNTGTPPATIQVRKFDHVIKSIALGTFSSPDAPGLALLTNDGTVHLLHPETGEGQAADSVPMLAAWQDERVGEGQWVAAEQLLRVKVSDFPGDDLLLVDADGKQLNVLAGDKLLARPSDGGNDATAAKVQGTIAALNVTKTPSALLTMRLDVDALDDLVVLTDGSDAPTVALTTQKGSVLNGEVTAQSAPVSNTYSVLGNGERAAGPPKSFQSKMEARAKASPAKTLAHVPGGLSPQYGGCPSVPISYGQALSGTLATNDCVFTSGSFFDSYSFNGRAGEQVAVVLISGNFDAFLYLLGPDDVTIGIDDDGNGGTDSRIPATSGYITLPASGSYTILVSSFNAGGTGDYIVSLGVNATSCTPTVMTYGQIYSGSLSVTDCPATNGAYSDLYTFQGLANQQIAVEMTSPSFDTILYLYDPSGNLLAVGDDANVFDSRIPQGGNFLTLPSSGTYFVIASSFSARITGDYQVRVRLNDLSPCTFTPIAYGNTLSGVLNTSCIPFSDNRYANIYAFYGVAGQPIAIRMFSSEVDSFLYLVGPSGTIITVDDDSGGGLDARIPPAGFGLLPQTGLYNIIATSANPLDTGAFQISLTVDVGSTVVTNTNDTGAGSLRQALLNANDIPGANTISFNIAGPGVKTITPQFPLPPVTGPVTIDGTTQPGYAGVPLIEINGSQAGSPTVNPVGLKILGGSSRIRGLVINRFSIAQIALTGPGGNLVDGNYLGTDPTGLIGRPAPDNGAIESHGVLIDSSSNNTIGGTTVAARNIISGNHDVGVLIERSARSFPQGNLVQGNYLGLNVNGTGAVPNGGNGVVFLTGTNNIIGGTAAGARNIVSGNSGPGIGLGGFGATTGNLVQGNYIGTNAAGTAAVANDGAGIVVGGILQRSSEIIIATRNLIGGTTAAARNIISGNVDSGIELGNTGTIDNNVQGNFIGSDVSGTALLGNGASGVLVVFANGNVVGGAAAGAGNMIVGNGNFGVGVGLPITNPLTGQIIAGGKGIDIIGNFIGTNAAGTAHLGNVLDGVFIAADAVDNTIANNSIAFNGRNGVFIPKTTPGSTSTNPGLRNNLDTNLIYLNGALGIDLQDPGITANDLRDIDAGANLQQNFPSPLSFGAASVEDQIVAGKEWFDLHGPEVPLTPDALSITSQLNSTPNTTFVVNWYFSADAQCVTNQQGSRPLAFGRLPGITTNSNGDATFNFSFDFPPGLTSGVINTTATDPAGNTSEFSGCLPVNATPPSIRFSATGYSVNEGGVSATITVTRSGATGGASSVDFATSDGSATQNQDYVVTSGTINFAANETSKTFNVLIVNDAFVESAEAINLTLSNATGATLGTPSTATLTITDNDTAGSSSPAPKRYSAFLNGAQETPANNSPGKGTGYVLLNQAETSASVSLQFQNLGSAETAAHIHTGAPGVPGPIVFPLTNGSPSSTTISPTAQQVADLKAGADYINVHSVNFPNGEIRGQLRWNPTLDDNFFVRQQYLDFLSRDGDPGGFNFWLNQVASCQADAQCLHDRTITTSNAFFFEPEFQQTAGYVFRAYRAAFGNTQPFPNPDSSNATEANKLIDYAAFVADRARVVGGADLAVAQQAFANQFVARPQFTSRYGSGLTGPQFVDAILANIQSADAVNLTAQRQALINQFNLGGRGMVLYRLADDNAQNPINNQAFINAEYNRQFALTLYFGYLRRNPDIGGFLFWQSQINLAPVRDVPKQNALVCSFLTAAEYQLRFGPNAPRSNAECPQ